jgi:Tannase and feruloyl esterase
MRYINSAHRWEFALSREAFVKLRIALSLCFAVLGLMLPRIAAAQTPCEKLADVTLTNATITSAAPVEPGGFKPPAAATLPVLGKELPAFCRVAGIAKPSSDSEIKFEVWLPATGWNGKYEQVGNGGFAGAIPFAAMAQALIHGYATAATDDGHVAGPGALWAVGHPEKVKDFGYRAVHETSVQAKALISAFYGKQATRFYFVGCSEGGREALTEAERYPDDFHGIVAGAPAINWNHLQTRGLWDSLALLETPESYIPPAKLPLLQNAAIAACDTLDGAKDGFIENPAICRFDPATIQCKGEDTSGCLTAPQVTAAKKIYDPLKNPRTGELIEFGFSPGGEGVAANWAVWITGGKPPQLGVQRVFAYQFFTDMVFENAKWDPKSFNFDSDVKFMDDKLGETLNSMNPNLRAFKSHGGKLIQYHGWSDAAIPALGSIGYFESVQKTMGDTKSFYRLFMIPTMSHCAGGPGATMFGNAGGYEAPSEDADHDVLLSLERWVEQGKAPERIIASGYVDGNPSKGIAMTHPLCPYPQQAHYKGSGDMKDANNFVCRRP